MENVLVIGASTNEERISNTAIVRLVKHQHNVFAIGLKPGIVAGIEIKTGQPFLQNIDTITMYVGAKNQPIFYDYILQIKPKRVIFNPGSENEELETLLQQNNIAFEQACTLVLLASGQF
jgi:predicted CoA-binding protein